uniref:Uncharacterized protein n=1 Tax=Meloidogyne hapla TaxID=6305 RepID=A0A1I8BH34_MELHA
MNREQQKQQISSAKRNCKAMPIELLINIFRAVNTYPDKIKFSQNVDVINSKNGKNYKTTYIYEQWKDYTTNLLTSSAIIYLFVEEAFRKKKGLIRERILL